MINWSKLIRGQSLILRSSLGGADFEIIPTNNMLPAHYLWAGSLHFPLRAGCFFHGRQVRPEKSEATWPIPWYQDRAGYAPLRSRCRCWWTRRWHIIAIIGLHCLPEIGTLSQNRYWFWRRKLAQLLYLGLSPFCTRSRGLVLKPQSLPHRVKLFSSLAATDLLWRASSVGRHAAVRAEQIEAAGTRASFGNLDHTRCVWI